VIRKPVYFINIYNIYSKYFFYGYKELGEYKYTFVILVKRQTLVTVIVQILPS
jgi:hypothetical protein